MLGDWLAGSVFDEIAALLVLAAATGFVGPFQDAAYRAVELLESNRRPVRLETEEPEEQKDIGV